MEVNTLPTRSYQNLRVYRRANTLASEVFWLTRRFPNTEKYALTDQLRRTARAIPVSVIQGWNLRYDGASFREYLEEAQSACARLGLWLDFALECAYLSRDEHAVLTTRKSDLQRMISRLYDQRIALLS